MTGSPKSFMFMAALGLSINIYKPSIFGDPHDCGNPKNVWGLNQKNQKKTSHRDHHWYGMMVIDDSMAWYDRTFPRDSYHELANHGEPTMNQPVPHVSDQQKFLDETYGMDVAAGIPWEISNQHISTCLKMGWILLRMDLGTDDP